MSDPIVKVLDADGNVLHDCAAAGCPVSWDGYVLDDGYLVEQPSPDVPGETVSSPLAKGDRVPKAVDPGDAWDVSRPGVARLKPPKG